jgi:hypothetical protein
LVPAPQYCDGCTDTDTWVKLEARFVPSNASPSDQATNQPLVEQWKRTIAFFGKTFHHKTLALTEGMLVNFSATDNSTTSRQQLDEYIASPGTRIGTNVKQMQTISLRACRDQLPAIGGNSGLPEVLGYTRRGLGILGADQFGTALTPSKKTASMGDPTNCYSTDPTISITQAANGVFAVLFNDTSLPNNRYCTLRPNKESRGECNQAAPWGTAPGVVNAVQIYSTDLDYFDAATSAADVQAFESVLLQANSDLLTLAHSPIERAAGLYGSNESSSGYSR